MTYNEESKVAERIHLMLEEAKRILEEAKREASELRGERKSKRNRKRNGWRASFPKKEGMLNIRIAKELEEKIKREAKKRKMPVSALVRDVLEEVFNLLGAEHSQTRATSTPLQWYQSLPFVNFFPQKGKKKEKEV